jgi:hypothetical protein
VLQALQVHQVQFQEQQGQQVLLEQQVQQVQLQDQQAPPDQKVMLVKAVQL